MRVVSLTLIVAGVSLLLGTALYVALAPWEPALSANTTVLVGLER